MYTYKAKVLKIIDGDTLDLLIDIGFDIHIKERVRLYGVDCPETRTRDLKEKARGLAAKAYVKDMVKGKEVRIQTHKDGKGKFGRYLVEVWAGDNPANSINEMLISEGHAKAYFGKSKKGLHDV